MTDLILPMLVVDKNTEVSLREQAEWKKHGIDTVQVNTMQEAIEKLTKESFLFTAINADNINYLPLLRVMRDTAPTFIFIISSNHTTAKEVEALHNGADVFTKFNKNVELNVQLALAQLLRCNERNRSPAIPLGMIIYENFLVLSNERRIYCNDERIMLTRKEFDLLCYFIENHDYPLSYEKIFINVFDRRLEQSDQKSLWDYVAKIRKKLEESAGARDYIITERDMGYIFSAKKTRKSSEDSNS